MKRSMLIWIVSGIIVIVGGIVVVRMKSLAANKPLLTVQYQGEDGKSAMELLKSHATAKTATDSVLGEYVTSINGKESGTNGKYWVLYINGQPTAMNANRYATKSTDTLEWKLE